MLSVIASGGGRLAFGKDLRNSLLRFDGRVVASPSETPCTMAGLPANSPALPSEGLPMAANVRRTRRSRSDQLDLIFRALGDRTRRGLLARLRQGPAIVTELARPFAMSLPAVSRHIRVLEEARLVSRQIDGKIHRCSLTAAAFREADRWLRAYRRFWEDTLASLASYVEDDRKTARLTGGRGNASR